MAPSIAKTKVAERSTIVTLMCDTGMKYLSQRAQG